MAATLQINQNFFNPVYIANGNLNDYSHRWNFYMGGAGSGKSRYIAQKLIIKALRFPNSRTLVCRSVGNKLQNSVMLEFKEVLTKLGIFNNCLISDYARLYRLPNGSEIVFMGLDDEHKLLSISKISTIFVEEVYEVNEDILTQLNLRLRGTDAPNEIYAAFNPISKNHYLHRWLEETPEKYFDEGDLYYLRTTWRDNFFLKEDYIRQIHKLKDSNPMKWRIYSEGLWGVDTDGLVYPKHRVADFDINKVLKLPKSEVRIGLDLGYSIDPCGLCVSVFDNANKRIFILDEMYKRGLTQEEVFDELVKHKVANTHNKFYCDTNEPRLFDYLKGRGTNMTKVKKTSIKLGVYFLQDYNIWIHPSCTNFLNEIQNYTYKKDVRTNEYINDKFEGADHLMDALRYSASDLYKTGSLNTSDSNYFFKF